MRPSAAVAASEPPKNHPGQNAPSQSARRQISGAVKTRVTIYCAVKTPSPSARRKNPRGLNNPVLLKPLVPSKLQWRQNPRGVKTRGCPESTQNKRSTRILLAYDAYSMKILPMRLVVTHIYAHSSVQNVRYSIVLERTFARYAVGQNITAIT